MDVNKQLVTNNDNTYLGITCQKPKFPQYAVVSKRLESYRTWPDYLPVKPQTLADAGLVYTGVGDSVRCYFCGGGLRNWDRGDSAWFEHAKWYPSCPHVLLVKGQGFVDRVKRGEHPESDGHTPVSKPVSEDDHLNSPAAQSCLENGFSKCEVKRAISQYIKTRGNANFKGVDLCQLMFQQDEEESNITQRVEAINIMDGVKAATGSVDDNEQATCGTGEKEEDFDQLYEENRRLKENKLCKICLDESANIIFLPCGHMVSCPQCAPALVKCPMCRMAVKGYVKAYFAESSK